jgi:hypothetical protein
MLDASARGGLVLDLQVIRPNPLVEVDGTTICEIDGEPLFEWADAASAALDARVEAGDLVDEAQDDHDVLAHYESGPDLLDDFAESKRRIPDAGIPLVRAIDRPCAVRERCRLRRLRLA